MVSCRMFPMAARVRAGVVSAVAGMALLVTAGCGVLNPALVGTIGFDSTPALDSPEGTILIVVTNSTPSTAAARFEITKRNGGTVDLILPVQPFTGNPADESDRIIAVQDCDITSIQLLDVLASLPAGGVQQFASDLAPLNMGERIHCGNVILLSLEGEAPNLLVNLGVF